MPIELSNSRKGLINIKNNDQKCFLWCHVRHINPIEKHLGRIKKTDRRIASNFNYEGTDFPVQEKDFKKLKYKIIFLLMCLIMKMSWFIQFLFLSKHSKTQ